jgi:hypothetical protein
MLKRLAGIGFARSQASELLERFGVETAEHLHVEGFAHRLGLSLVETKIDGSKGLLLVGERDASIVIPQQLTDLWERRWLIAHEMGHYLMEHPAASASELCRPHTRPRPHHRHPEEEANGFASALLLPESLVAKVCDELPVTLVAPLSLAMSCRAPFAMSALRTTGASWQCCALVASQRGRIQFVAPSVPWLLLCGRQLVAGQMIGTGARARAFDASGEKQYDVEPQNVPVSAWLQDLPAEGQLYEHSIGVPEFEGALTMLFAQVEPHPPRPAHLTIQVMTLMRDYLLAMIDHKPRTFDRMRAEVIRRAANDDHGVFSAFFRERAA